MSSVYPTSTLDHKEEQGPLSLGSPVEAQMLAQCLWAEPAFPALLSSQLTLKLFWLFAYKTLKL